MSFQLSLVRRGEGGGAKSIDQNAHMNASVGSLTQFFGKEISDEAFAENISFKVDGVLGGIDACQKTFVVGIIFKKDLFLSPNLIFCLI